MSYWPSLRHFGAERLASTCRSARQRGPARSSGILAVIVRSVQRPSPPQPTRPRRRLAHEMLDCDCGAGRGTDESDVHPFHDAARHPVVRIVEDDDAGGIRHAAIEIAGKIRHPLHSERTPCEPPTQAGIAWRKLLAQLGMNADLGRNLDLDLRRRADKLARRARRSVRAKR